MMFALNYTIVKSRQTSSYLLQEASTLLQHSDGRTTSRPTSVSSFKELILSCKLN